MQDKPKLKEHQDGRWSVVWKGKEYRRHDEIRFYRVVNGMIGYQAKDAGEWAIYFGGEPFISGCISVGHFGVLPDGTRYCSFNLNGECFIKICHPDGTIKQNRESFGGIWVMKELEGHIVAIVSRDSGSDNAFGMPIPDHFIFIDGEEHKIAIEPFDLRIKDGILTYKGTGSDKRFDIPLPA